jgi:hypothetical protein
MAIPAFHAVAAPAPVPIPAAHPVPSIEHISAGFATLSVQRESSAVSGSSGMAKDKVSVLA